MDPVVTVDVNATLCSYCRREIPRFVSRCPNCGRDLTDGTKIIYCPACGGLMNMSLKNCPACGADPRAAARQEEPDEDEAEERTGIGVGKIIGICLGVLALIALLYFALAPGGFLRRATPDDKPREAAPAVESAQEPGGEEEAVVEPSAYGIGETAALGDVSVTLLSVEKSEGGETNPPKTGNEFVVCEFRIVNHSSEAVSVSSMLSFSASVDHRSASLRYSALLSTDKPQLDGTVEAGETLEGVLGYELPEDWEELEILFKPDFLPEETVTFRAQHP